MNSFIWFALSALATPASADAPLAPARIAFANSGGIADFYARNEDGIYLLDRTGRWYYADFHGPCPRLPSLPDVGFDTGVAGDFDSFSSVLADGLRCSVNSVVRTKRPAEVGLKGKASAAR